jgi:hypothetical protein
MARSLFGCVPGAGVVAAVVLAATGGPALAAPEEIQVYLDEMSAPGHFGLDVHTNVAATGGAGQDYPGQQLSGGRLRITPEFAYGLTRALEAGLYLPLATLDHAGRFGFEGAKVRLKYIAPRAERQSWFWGGNFEIGRVDRRLDENPWNAEFKGILGHRRGRWTLAINTNVDFTVSGPVPSPATLELASSLTYALDHSWAIGVESYNGLGALRRFGTFEASDQSSYVTVSRSFGRWDVSVGVGAGYGANRDGMTFKAIIGVPIS